ncbi:MAG: hypothetical protein HQL06_08875 [Nitrospirae bacterium]|nr:hypothetical protein [Nitrospirota bacterium]
MYKKTNESVLNTAINIRLNKNDYDMLFQLAENETTGVSVMARKILLKHLPDHCKKLKTTTNKH